MNKRYLAAALVALSILSGCGGDAAPPVPTHPPQEPLSDDPSEQKQAAGKAVWIDIRNARAPFDGIVTGGQPTADELALAARNGYRTVVNLRGSGEDGELVDEAAIVEDLGMRYVAIPMASGDDLNAENASKLAQTLKAAGALPALVHCASGNRVGALFGLKAHLQDGQSAEAALQTARAAGISRMEPTLRQRLGMPPAE